MVKTGKKTVSHGKRDHNYGEGEGWWREEGIYSKLMLTALSRYLTGLEDIKCI